MADRIIQQTIIPRIRANDNVGAVEAGVEAIATAIGEPLPGASSIPPPQAEREAEPLTLARFSASNSYLHRSGSSGNEPRSCHMASHQSPFRRQSTRTRWMGRRRRLDRRWMGGGGVAGVVEAAAGAVEVDSAAAEDRPAVEARAAHGDDPKAIAEFD
jgi:uncharacterized membrane protein YgcG